MKKSIILATNNPAKIQDFTGFSKEYHLNLVTLKEYGLDLDIKETGTTYYENASIKAQKIHEVTGKTVIAEDSGFEFDYLNGEPGIYSKKYLGNISFKKRINTILSRMKGAIKPEQRGISFNGSIVCITSNKTIIHQDFSLHTICAYEAQGYDGNPYHSIMWIPSYGKTVANLSPIDWDKINPRIPAIEQIYKSLKED